MRRRAARPHVVLAYRARAKAKPRGTHRRSARGHARTARWSCRACRPKTTVHSIPRRRRAPAWGSPPKRSGETAGVRRSDSPHAFAAAGPLAAAITAAHPIDPPHGSDSPVDRARDHDAQVLLLGVGHDANTTIHLAEHEAGVRYRRAKHVTVLEMGPTGACWTTIQSHHGWFAIRVWCHRWHGSSRDSAARGAIGWTRPSAALFGTGCPGHVRDIEVSAQRPASRRRARRSTSGTTRLR